MRKVKTFVFALIETVNLVLNLLCEPARAAFALSFMDYAFGAFFFLRVLLSGRLGVRCALGSLLHL